MKKTVYILIIFILTNISLLHAQTVKLDAPAGTIGCNGNPATLTFTIGPGTTGPNYEYYYSVDGGAWTMVTGANPYSIAVTTAGTYVIEDCIDLGTGLHVGINGGHSTQIITEYAQATVAITPDPANTSISTNLTLSSNASGGTAPLTYDWTDGGAGNLVAPTNGTSVVFNGASPGSYVVTCQTTDANSCIVSDNVTVTVINLSASIVSPADGYDACYGTAFSLDGEALNGSGSYTYNWSYSSAGTGSFSSTSVEDPTFTPNSVTSYTLTFTVTDVGVTPNVSASTSITINSNAIPSDKTIIVVQRCIPDDGSITVVSSENNVDYELTGAVSGIIGTLTGDGSDLTWTLGVDDYSIVATNAIGCERDFIGPYTIGAYNKPTINPVAVDNTLCEGETTLINSNAAAGAVPSGAITGYSWSWDNASTMTPSTTAQNPTVQPSVIGNTNYTVTVTDANGCSQSATETVSLTAAPVVTILNTDDSICKGQSTTLSATADKAIASWNWESGPATATAAVGDTTVAPSITTVYDLIVTDTDGCSTTKKDTITVNPIPTANAGLDKQMCLGAGLTLIGSASGGTGAITYSWSGGSSVPPTGTLVNPSPVGIYSYILTVNDVNNCADKDTVKVTAVENPTVEAGLSQQSCSGEEVDFEANSLSGKAPYTYSWEGGAFVTDSTYAVNPTNSTPGSLPKVYYYDVTIKDNNNCYGNDSVKVTVNSYANITIDNANKYYCQDAGTVTLTATPSGGNWSSPDGLALYGANNSQFDTDPGSNSPDEYRVVYTYNDGTCTTEKQSKITILPYSSPSNLAIDIPNSALFCSTDPGPYTLTGSMNPDLAGQSGVTESFTFSGPALAFNDNGNGTAGFDPSIAGEGSYTVTYNVTTPGCSNSVTEDIIVGTAVNYIGLPSSMCVNDADFTLAADNVNGDWTIRFVNASSVETSNITVPYGDANAVLQATEPGTYYISYELTNPGEYNCSPEDSVIINALPTVSFTIDGKPYTDLDINFCENGELVSLVGNNATNNLFTSVPSAVTGNQFDPSTGAGTYIITYKHTDANGCSNSVDSKPVKVNATPVVTIDGFNATNSYCKGDAAYTITGNPTSAPPDGQFRFPATWSDGTQYTDNGDGTAEIDPGAVIITGGYNIIYKATDLNGCTDSIIETIDINPLPTVDFLGLPATICKNGSAVTLTGSPKNANGLFTGDGISDNGDGTATFDPNGLSSGNHTITYTYTDPITLCENSKSYTINVLALPVKYNVTTSLGLKYCETDAGITIGVDNSQLAVLPDEYKYYLMQGATQVDVETGTGAAFDFSGSYPAGNYTVVAENPDGCKVTFNDTITPIEVPKVDGAGTIDGSTSICADGLTIYTYSVAPIANATDYNWTLPAGVSKINDYGDTIEVTFDATYVSGSKIEVYGYDVSSVCPQGNSSSLTITSNPIPTDDVGPAPITSSTGAFNVCEGQTGVVFSVDPADFSNETQFEWQISAGAASIVTSSTASSVTVDFNVGSVTGTIRVRAKNACGTTSWITQAITVDPIPDVSINALGPGDVITCAAGSQVQLNGASTENPGDIDGWLWYSTNGGVIVAGDENVQDPNVTKEGDYVVQIKVTKNLACYNTDTITVGADKVAPTVSIDPAEDLTCTNGGLVTLQANATNVSYNWTFTPPANISSPAAAPYNTSNPTVSHSGTYTVTVTDLSNSCTASASVTIADNRILPDVSVVSPSVDTITCKPTEQTALLDGASSSSNTTFLWTGPASANITNSTLEDATTDLDGTYTLLVTDTINGCSDSKTVVVNKDDTAPVATITNIDASYNELTCTNTEVDLQASVAGVSDATFAWSTAGGNFVSQTGTYNQYAKVDVAATYTVVATNPANGCTSVAVNEAVGEDLSTATTTTITSAGTDLTCSNGGTLNLVANITGDAGGTYAWTGTGTLVPPLNANNVDVTSAGNYTLTYAHSVTGCETNANIVIADKTAAPTVTIDPGPYVITCADLTTKKAIKPTLTATCSDPAATYQWTGPTGATYSDDHALSTTVDKSGTYTITATNSYGCTNSDNVVVTLDKTAPTITVIDPATNDITCANPTVTLSGGTTTGTATLKWTGPSGATITGETTTAPSVNLAGVYTLTVTDGANGCTATDDVTVYDNYDSPNITVTDPAADKLTCSATQIELSTSTPVTGVTYAWTGPSGATITNVNSSGPWVDKVGTYTVVATHPTSGCTQTETIDVTSDYTQPNVIINPEANVITCTQSTINLDASASTNATGGFVWSTVNGNIVSGGTSNTAVVSKAGTYNLIATNATTGCTETGQVIITENITQPNVNITGAPYTITCNDSTPTLTAIVDVGSSVVWSGPGTITDPATLNPTVDAAGTYVITATAANGCTSTDNVLVTNDNAKPDITVDTNTDDITCTDTLVTISGSSVTSGVTYAWQVLSGGGNITNNTSASTTVDAAGDYKLTITAPNGCTNTDVVSVGSNKTSPNIGLPATDDDEITCSQTTVALNGSSSTSGAQFSWSTLITGATILNGNSPTPTVNKTGDYTLTVTDPANGCTSTKTTTVTGTFTKPTVSIASPSQLTCLNPTEILTATSGDGTNFNWTATLGGHILSNGGTATPTVDAAGRYIVSVEHTSTGCIGRDTVDVTEDNSVPVIDVFDPFPGDINCTNGTVTLSADATGLGVNKDISWATSDGHFTTATNISAPTVDQGGTYVVTITNTANSCSTVRGVTISQNNTAPTITIDTPLDFTCSRTQVNLNANGTSVDASPVTYSWVSGAGGNIVSGSSTATVIVDAVADYTVTVKDLGNGCESSSTVSTSENKTPPDVSVDASPDQITCDNATVILNGSSTYPNVNYQWTTTGSGTIQNANTETPIVNAAGTYNLIVTNTDNNCTDTSSNVVVTEDKVTPSVTVNSPSGDLTCSVNQVTISVSEDADYSYSWSGPGTIVTPNSHSTNVDAAGTYTVLVEDISNGCTNSYTTDVTEDKTPIASPTINNTETCFGTANPAFTVISGNNVKWYADATLNTYLTTGNTYTPIATTAGNHTYYATSTGTNGCESLPKEVILTIHDLPNAPSTLGNAICEGGTAKSISAVGSNIKWYDNTSTFIVASTTYTPADVAAGTYTYYATQTDAEGCESAQTAATYTINPIPAQPVFVNSTLEVCETETNPEFTVVGDNIKWYKNLSGSPVSTGNSIQPNEILPGTYTYYATQTVNSCESPENSGTITINPMPVKYNVTGGGSYCEGTGGVSVGLSNSEAGVTYELWLDETTLVSDLMGTGAALDFGNQTAEGNYTVYGYNATSLCKRKMNGGVDVVENLLPGNAGTITGSATVCQTETGVTYTIDTVSGATTYIWSVPSGFNIVSGDNSNTITVNIDNTASDGNISVYAKNACGVGNTSPQLFVTVNPIPGPALNLTGPNTICNDEDGVIYSIDAVNNAKSYNWELPQGASVVAGANSRQITLNFDNTAVDDIIKVSAVNGCGEGTPVSQLINVTSLPYVSAGDQQDLCADNTILDGNTPSSGTGTWSVYSGAATITNPNNPTSSITNVGEGQNKLVWTVTASGCSLSDTVLITNNQVIVEAGNNQTICSEEITMSGSNVPTDAVGSWSVVTGAASFTDGNSPSTAANSFASGTNILKWAVTKGGCSNYDTVIINNQRPTQAYAGINQSICKDSTILSANAATVGRGLWTVVVGAATFENDTLYNTKVKGLSKGDNVLRWTISNGICSTSDDVKITNNKLSLNAGVDQVICSNTTTLDAVDPPSGTPYWAVDTGSAVFVSTDLYNTVVTGLAKGLNILTWNVNNNGCISSDTVSIINDSPTKADAGKDTIVEVDYATLQGNIPTTGSGVWSLISGSAVIENPTQYNTNATNLAFGDNTFRWTVTNNSCISTDDVIIKNNTPTDVNAGPDQSICSDETSLEGTQPRYYGQWSVVKGSAIFSNPDEPVTDVSSLAKGENILRWSVWQNGWTYDDVVISNDSPTNANAGSDQVLCTDSVYLSANNPIIGSGKWTVVSGSGQFENDTIYNTKVTNLTQGENIFKWTITNKSCSSEDLVKVTNNSPTEAYAGLDQSICTNKVTLNPNTPSIGTGEWSIISGAGNFDGNVVTYLAPDTNILRWTIVNNGCNSYDDVTIVNNEPSNANAGADKTICLDSVSLSANIPVKGTAVWSIQSGSGSIGDIHDATTTATNLNSGINVFRWTITYNGCTKFDEVNINNALVEATTGVDQEICSESTVLDANNPESGAGLWSVVGGSGSAFFENANQADTRVDGLDKGQNILRWTITNEICVSYSDVIITNNLPTEASAGPDQSLCTNNTTLQGSSPLIGDGEWSVLSGSATIADPASPYSNISNLSYGVNTLRWSITNGGCVSSDEVVISNNSTEVSNAGNDQSICADSTIMFANAPNLGIGQWSVISGSATFEDNNQYNTKVTGLGSGTNILKWVISNDGCSSSDEVSVTNNSPTKAIAGADQAICGDHTFLQANVPTIGTGEWALVSGAANFTDKTDYNTEVSGLNAGNNTLRWTIVNQGCSSSDDVVIYNDLPYKADAGADFEICSSTTSLYANDPATGVGEWTVISGSAAFDDASQYDATVSDLGFGANTLRWTITYDACSTYDEVVVTNNKIKVNAGVDQTVKESSTLLAASNPSSGSGEWSVIGGSGVFADQTNAITEVSNLGSGLNTFRWSVDINGCISSDDVSVTYDVLPTASFVMTASKGCPPLNIYFVNNSLDGLPFTWDFDDGDTSSQVTVKHIYSEPGIYYPSLTIVDDNGDIVVKDTTVEVYSVPQASFLIVNRQVYIPEEEAIFINTSTDAVKYQWDFGDGGTSTETDPKYIYEKAGTYDITLNAWSENNCYDSIKVAGGVDVFESGTVKFPTAFTPNLDGPSGGAYDPNDFSNDVFYPISEGLEDYHLEVFNRWGVLVFESYDLNIGWDGYYDNKLLDEGVYVWKVTGKYNNGKDFKKVGTVLLLH